MIESNSKIFLISGPSGVGKDSVINKVREIFIDFHFVITAVTRKRRIEEKEGINHFFVSIPEFEKMINNNELIEWSEVYNNFYGVPKSQIDVPVSEGKNVLIRVDVQGANKIKNLIPEVVSIFIKPENIEAIKMHLSNREGISNEEILRRLNAAEEEIKLSKFFDYVITNPEGNIEYVIDEERDIINKNLK